MSMPSYNQKKYIIKIFQDIEEPDWEIRFKEIKGKCWTFTTLKDEKYIGVSKKTINKILKLIKKVSENPDILKINIMELYPIKKGLYKKEVK